MATRKTLYVDANGDYIESTGMFETSDYINTSAGVADAGKPVVLNADGKIDPTMISFDSLSWKEPVRVSSTANVNISSAPATIDGVTLTSGDRVLLKDQTTGSENGIYVFNGAASAMTRSLDANTDAEVKAGMVVVVEEGTVNADRTYVLTTDNPITLNTTTLTFATLPVNTFSAGDGIDITSNVISVDLLDTGSGLEFAGAGTDELAIDFAATFTIDGADDLAPKASDYASTTNGKGASIIGIEDASSYYTGTDLETVFNELEAQLGGDTSSTYNFGENNVLIDNDAVYAALNKLDLKWGDLASTANGEGASLVGVEDANSNYTATDVEGVLNEIATKLIDRDCATAGAGGVTVGDLLYFSADNTVLPMAITASNRAVGIALETKSAGQEVCYARYDEVALGVLTSATAGTRYYWDGSALTTTIPSGSGQYVWQAGIAKNATDLLLTVEFIKKNT